MSWFVGVLVWLLIFGVFLYVLSLILDLIIPQMGLPAQIKPIVIGIFGLILLIWLFFGLGTRPLEGRPVIEAPTAIDALLLCVAGQLTALPTLAVVQEASGVEPDVLADQIAEAQEAGFLEVHEDLGPETVLILSPLGAERLGVELNWKSGRWCWRKSHRYVSGVRDRRDPWWKHAAAPDPKRVEMDQRVDIKVIPPDRLVELREEAERRFAYDEDHLPYQRHLLGVGTQWPPPEKPACPVCEGKKLGVNTYCLWCDNTGATTFLPKVQRPSRRLTPWSNKRSTDLRGGV